MVNKKVKVTGVTRQKEEERKENVTTDEEMDLCGKCEHHVVKDGQRGLECGLSSFTWFHARCQVVKEGQRGLECGLSSFTWFHARYEVVKDGQSGLECAHNSDK
ncbi:hypothetical protein Pmani_000660 [Petrolisthes manimaculis]|uniref:PHD-type domain-containing protein n=1 Tax=Petrolisthes manimaculis TaxID=1843537 RepID=A0AAE1UQ42_9EUCA|nr:hypothetical protein Pmani_000660 [Petrolisthes manimaculis]